MNARSYLLRISLYAIIALLAVFALNYAVDPYGITGTKRIAHFNQYKVDINNYTRLNKKYQPQFEDHNAIVVGNSRVEMGIDPAHSCFQSSDLNVYNLGMPGADVETQLAHALNVIYQQPIKTVFLSVDFIDFISTEPTPSPVKKLMQQTAGELKYLPSGKANPDYHKAMFLDYYMSLLSLDALVSSIKTIVLQSSAAPDRDVNGFNPARDFEAAVRIEGPRALFDQKMQNLKSKYGHTWYLRDSAGNLPATFGNIDEFLSVAFERGIKVYLFTHPFHDSYWELLQSGGLMPLYADWLSSMETLLRKRGGDDIEFWDFSGDSPYIHEKIPDAGARTGPLDWFWEPAHYRRELGDLMVDAIMSGSCDNAVQFGRKIL